MRFLQVMKKKTYSGTAGATTVTAATTAVTTDTLAPTLTPSAKLNLH